MINATYNELAPAGAICADDMKPMSASRRMAGVALTVSRSLFFSVKKFDGHASQYFAALADARNHAGRVVVGL